MALFTRFHHLQSVYGRSRVQDYSKTVMSCSSLSLCQYASFAHKPYAENAHVVLVLLLFGY